MEIGNYGLGNGVCFKRTVILGIFCSTLEIKAKSNFESIQIKNRS